MEKRLHFSSTSAILTIPIISTGRKQLFCTESSNRKQLKKSGCPFWVRCLGWPHWSPFSPAPTNLALSMNVDSTLRGVGSASYGLKRASTETCNAVTLSNCPAGTMSCCPGADNECCSGSSGTGTCCPDGCYSDSEAVCCAPHDYGACTPLFPTCCGPTCCAIGAVCVGGGTCLSVGAIVGIVFGCIGLILAIIVLVLRLIIMRRR
jgi:hypothetical protein